jgi:hypothetical protein
VYNEETMSEGKIAKKIGIVAILLIATNCPCWSASQFGEEKVYKGDGRRVDSIVAIEEMRDAVRGAYEAAGIEYIPVKEVPEEFRGLSFEECMQYIHDIAEETLDIVLGRNTPTEAWRIPPGKRHPESIPFHRDGSSENSEKLVKILWKERNLIQIELAKVLRENEIKQPDNTARLIMQEGAILYVLNIAPTSSNFDRTKIYLPKSNPDIESCRRALIRGPLFPLKIMCNFTSPLESLDANIKVHDAYSESEVLPTKEEIRRLYFPGTTPSWYLKVVNSIMFGATDDRGRIAEA